MKKICFVITIVLLFGSCIGKEESSNKKGNRLELLPEPNKKLRVNYDQVQKYKKIDCDFYSPDTSVFDIKIRDIASVLKVLGKNIQLKEDTSYLFHSNNGKQILELKVYPGDILNQVSMFSVYFSRGAKQKSAKLNTKSFQTEKNIELGISKKQIIEKLGKCYFVKDSIGQNIKLCYRIELPKDAKNRLLFNNNMPIYSASYHFVDNKLQFFEFGFEYP